MRFTTLIALIGLTAAIKHHKTPAQIAAADAAFENGTDPDAKKEKEDPVPAESSKLPECEYVLSEDGTSCDAKQPACIASEDAPVLAKCPARTTSEESARFEWKYNRDPVTGDKVWYSAYAS